MLSKITTICEKCNKETVSLGFVDSRQEIEEGTIPEGMRREFTFYDVCDDCKDLQDKQRGKEIRALRLERNLTLRQRAAELNISALSLSAHENGKIKIDDALFERLKTFKELKSE